MVNELISVFGRLVEKVDPTLDLYQEWYTYTKTPRPSDVTAADYNELFLDLLYNQGKIKLPERPLLEQLQSNYKTFFNWDRPPTAEDMFDCRLAVREEHWRKMTIRSQELLATGYRQPPFAPDRDFYFRWLSDKTVASFESKELTVLANREEELKQLAFKEHGFIIQCVNADVPDLHWENFGCTTGFEDMFGYELLAVNLGNKIGRFLSNVAELIRDGATVTDVFEFAHVFVKVYGIDQKLRGRVEEIPVDAGTAKNIGGDLVKAKRVRQLFIADKNNILPHEPGYDQGFIQSIDEPI